MSRWVAWVGAAFLFVGSFAFLDPTGSTQAGPQGPQRFQAELTLPEHDFGRLVGTVERDAELFLENSTDSTWTLRKTWGECGCIELHEASDVVEPGDKARLVVRIDTDRQPGGPLRKKVHALYDPGPRLVTLTARAVLAPRPHVEPYLLDTVLEEGETEWRASGAVQTPYFAGEVLVEASPRQAQLELAAPESTDAGLRFPFEVRGTLPVGVRRSVYEFELSASGNPQFPAGERVTIPGVVRRPLPLSASPRALVLSAGDPGAAATQSVWLRHPGGTWPARVDVRVPGDSGLTAEYDASEGRLDLRVETASQPSVPTSVRIEVLAEHGVSVEIPVRRLAAGSAR